MNIQKRKSTRKIRRPEMQNKARAADVVPKFKTGFLRHLHGLAIALVLLTCMACQDRNQQAVLPPIDGDSPNATAPPLTGVIVNAEQVTEQKLDEWKGSGITLVLNVTTTANHEIERQAAEAITNAGLELDYFIEVGRCPELANQHPEWMASLQGHPEWRKQFPDIPLPNKNQVIKNYPWVPILYQESFAAHLDRIQNLLADKPPAKRIWLNDLQGAPSACGCGHPLCRWTADYGPIKTATPLGQQAAADFVKQVSKIAGAAKIIPIFVGECEADDKDTVCCGVACYEGKCWKDFTKQLDFLAKESDLIGVSCCYKQFERDLARYGEVAGWVSFTLNSFSEMPKKRDGVGVTPDRLIAVLQGWNLTDAEIQSQVQQAVQSHAAGWLIALAPIEQSWQPVLLDLPPKTTDALTTDSSNHQPK
jgi:hypothetical protein